MSKKNTSAGDLAIKYTGLTSIGISALSTAASLNPITGTAVFITSMYLYTKLLNKILNI